MWVVESEEYAAQLQQLAEGWDVAEERLRTPFSSPGVSQRPEKSLSGLCCAWSAGKKVDCAHALESILPLMQA